MPTTDSAKLYGRWLALWNGDLAAAPDLIAPDCVVHHPALASAPADPRPGADRIVELVQQGRAPFSPLVFSLDVGPIEEGDKIAARWTGRGSYRGGLPGATAAAGTTVAFSGIDLFRLSDGRIAEYWVCSDALQLVQQLGGIAPPRA